MIYDNNNPPPDNKTRVFDGDGVEHDLVIRVDTVTGEIDQYKQEEDGSLVLSSGDTEVAIATTRKVVPLPITFRHA